MLQLVNAGHKSLADYATIATRGLMDEIRNLAEPLAGKRVVHLSATAFGGGVAEINYTLIPLMQDAGLETEWRIIRGAEEFYWHADIRPVLTVRAGFELGTGVAINVVAPESAASDLRAALAANVRA